jgi:hypothetical protein
MKQPRKAVLMKVARHLSGLALATLVATAQAVPIQWTVASGGNDHYYDVVDTGNTIYTWPQLQGAAAAMIHEGTYGHLATITSSAENSFIISSFANVYSLALGGLQLTGSSEPAGGWTWITGEVFSYTNWAGGEPNNAGGSENRLIFADWGPTGSSSRFSQWNDISDTYGALRGYVVEWDEFSATVVLEPGTLLFSALVCSDLDAVESQNNFGGV